MRPARPVLAALLGAAAITAAGCSTQAPQPPTEPSSITSSAPTPATASVQPARPSETVTATPRAPVPAPVDPTDANSIGTAYAATSWTFDTTTDHSPTDAQRRAASYATASLAAQLRQASPIAATGAAWDSLAARHGWTTVEASTAASPDAGPDTPTNTVRQATLHITSHDDTGWSDPSLFPPIVMFEHLTRTDPHAAWQIDSSSATPLN